jgi:hypothetical protein
MKMTSKILLFIILMTALLWPQAALAQDGQGNKFVLGGTYTLSAGEELDGTLFILGGNATLESGSHVTGDVMLAGGSLEADGQIDGDILAAGGLVNLGPNAVVGGDVSSLGAQVSVAEGARIEGTQRNLVGGPIQFSFPGVTTPPRIDVLINPVWEVLSFFFTAFLWAVLAILVALFLQRQVERTSRVVVTQPIISGGLGLLTLVVVPLILVVVAITLIGIPISLVGAVLLAFVWGFGMIAVGTEVGKRLAQVLKQEWAFAVSAGLGTFTLVIVVNGFNTLFPCIGWLARLLVAIVGVGAVLLTRFGTQDYQPSPPPLAPQGGTTGEDQAASLPPPASTDDQSQ